MGRYEGVGLIGSHSLFFCASSDIFNPSFMKSICLIVEGRGAEGGKEGDSQTRPTGYKWT